MSGDDKAELLRRYSEREPRRFVQIDGWIEGDDFIGIDESGHSVCMGATTELMHGSDARVLIPFSAVKKPADVAALLRKFADLVDQLAAESPDTRHPEDPWNEALAA